MKIFVTGGSGFLGTNMVEKLIQSNDVSLINFDVNEPKNADHLPYWVAGDICDMKHLKNIFDDFSPDIVIHMAARTDLDGKSLPEYASNTDGVSNIIKCCNESVYIKRVVFLSSMLVCRLGYQPKNDTDYCPTTLYGESKAIGERLVREQVRTGLDWVLLRPTSLWGPWFDIPYRTFFDSVRAGMFMMPSNLAVYRSYGFVLNSVEQIASIASPTNNLGLNKVHYLADKSPIELSDWAAKIINFSKKGKIHRVPWLLLKMLALGGDLLKLVGFSSPPITSFRLSNMTTNAIYDTESWVGICESQKYSTDDGVKITVNWMNTIK